MRELRWAAVAASALVALALVVGAASQTPGANGVLTYRARVVGDGNAVAGLGPLPGSLPTASGAAVFPGFARAAWDKDGNRAILENGSELWLWRAGGGQATKLVGAFADRASWSPDGAQFAYANFDGTNAAKAQIYVANADGSGPHLVSPNICGALLSLAWGQTPAGPKIAFVGSCVDFVAFIGWGLYTINPDGSGLTQVSGVSYDMASDGNLIDWAPDGSGKLAFGSVGGPLACEHGDCRSLRDIFLVDTTNGQVANLTKTDTWEGPHELGPVWSPDGKTIAYTADSESFDGSVHINRAAVWVMNADGSNRRMVTKEPPGTDPLLTYEDSVTWQPCTAATRFCTAAALASAANPTSPPSTTTTTTTTTTPTPPPPGCRRRRTLIIDGPNASGYPIAPLSSCWSEVVKFGGRQGCNMAHTGGDWAWNEIMSPRGRTPARDRNEVRGVKTCARTAKRGILFYAADASLPVPWSVGWKAAAGTRWKLLELYGCQRGQPSCRGDSHQDVVTERPRNVLALWNATETRAFGAVVNIGGSNVSTAEVGALVLQACRATKIDAFAVYWGSSAAERANLTMKRLATVRYALNSCLGSSS